MFKCGLETGLFPHT